MLMNIKELLAAADKDESLWEPSAIEPACIAAMQAGVARKFDLFGASGKADRY
jgi:hypothetical protein